MKTLEEIVGNGTASGDAAEAGMPADAPDAAPHGVDADGDADAGTDDGDGDAVAAEPEAARDRMVPVGALIDERRKRRAAEERLARRGQGEAGAPEGPGFRDDPEGYLTALRAELSGEIAAVRVDAAESAARARHADFDIKAGAFARIARGEPALIAAMRAAPDPAEFAYRLGARVLAGLAGMSVQGVTGTGPRPAAGTPAAAPPPESLSDSPSAAGPPAATWRPKPLSDIVGRR